MNSELNFQGIERAADRVHRHLLKTPVIQSEPINSRFGVEAFFKCENLQIGGAFKPRGATNSALVRGREQLARGIVTESSGNHGMAVAFAGRLLGVPVYVAMPETSRKPKVENVRFFGGHIHFCAPTAEGRREMVKQIIAETGATLIHPFEDPLVMCGQGTVGLELLSQVTDLDTVLIPVGGGGLISGCVTAIKHLSPKTRVIGVEPQGADDLRRSLDSGTIVTLPSPKTIADGLIAGVGEQTFAVIQKFVDDVVTVSDSEITEAMKILWAGVKAVVEPSGATAAAALFSGKVKAKRVGIILSGGNVECPWVLSNDRLQASLS